MEGLLILIGIWVLDIVIKKVAANRREQQQQQQVPPQYQTDDDELDESEEWCSGNQSPWLCVDGNSRLIPSADGALLASWRRVQILLTSSLLSIPVGISRANKPH